VAEAISVALGDDWRRDRCDTLIKQLGEAFSDKQGKLFEPTNEENVEKLRDINGAGYPLRRLILECVTQEFEHGATVSDAILTGTERALGERVVRGNLSVEEHYRRSDVDLAISVRGRIEQAASIAPIREIASQLLKLGGSSAASTHKLDGLDDGVSLP